MGPDLRDPLLGDVEKGGGVDQTEAEEEDVGVGVGQRSEFIELLLEGREAELGFDGRMSEKGPSHRNGGETWTVGERHHR